MRRLTPLLALALLGCDATPPAPTGCELPLTPSIDGTAVSFRVEGCAQGELSSRLLGTGNLDLSYRWEDGALIPSVSGGVAGGVLSGLVLEGDLQVEGTEPVRLWKQGYQSWSFSGVVELEPWEVGDDAVVAAGGDGTTGSFLRDNASTSWWNGLLGTDTGSILFGALDAQRFPFRLAAQPGPELQLLWGGREESVELAPGQSIDLAPLFVGAAPDPSALHARYAAAVAARHPPPALGTRPEVGWSTWYVFYEDVVEADVRSNLDLLAERGGVDLIQVDDGWQRVWGDWQADDGFPSGMPQLAADITAAGMEPGLWMAPLYVDRSTATWAEHPDWWVREFDGAQKVFENLGTGDYAVLDVTHPDAADWLTQQIRQQVDDGWTYLKLDFLYAGAEEGQRHVPMTGLQAYRLAMQAIAAGVDGDTTLLASGAPMLPSVGWFHAFRSGADIAFATDPDPRREYLRWSARCTAGRSWQNGVWWWNDADGIIVRDPFDEEDVRGALVAAAVSGGAWLLGDDLPALPLDRLDAQLDPQLLELVGTRFVPVDPLAFPSGFESSPILEVGARDDQVPVRWEAEGYTALLNLGDGAVVVDAPAGTDLLTGVTRPESGRITLLAGDGQIWRVD